MHLRLKFNELPSDCLVQIPYYLDSLDDLYTLIRTSRTFYSHCSDYRFKLPPKFNKHNDKSIFSPHPYLVVYGSARQVADWAVQSDENREKLKEALQGGIYGLLELCENVAEWTLKDANDLFEFKKNVLDPVVNKIDLAVGPQARVNSIGKELTPDVIEEYSKKDTTAIVQYPELSTLVHCIYSELFHHTVDKALDPDAVTVEPLSKIFRNLFLSYILPDEPNNNWTIVPEAIDKAAVEYVEKQWPDKIFPNRGGLLLYGQYVFYGETGESLFDSAVTGEVLDMVHPDRVGMGFTRLKLFNTIIFHKPKLFLKLAKLAYLFPMEEEDFFREGYDGSSPRDSSDEGSQVGGIRIGGDQEGDEPDFDNDEIREDEGDDGPLDDNDNMRPEKEEIDRETRGPFGFIYGTYDVGVKGYSYKYRDGERLWYTIAGARVHRPEDAQSDEAIDAFLDTQTEDTDPDPDKNAEWFHFDENRPFLQRLGNLMNARIALANKEGLENLSKPDEDKMEKVKKTLTESELAEIQEIKRKVLGENDSLANVSAYPDYDPEAGYGQDADEREATDEDRELVWGGLPPGAPPDFFGEPDPNKHVLSWVRIMSSPWMGINDDVGDIING